MRPKLHCVALVAALAQLLLTTFPDFAQPTNPSSTGSNKGVVSSTGTNRGLPSAKRTDKGSLYTDVFVLDTRDPTALSLIKMGSGKPDTVTRVRKLEMSARRLSAFKIIHINPLRYTYYINNQLVTQFMDVNSLNIPGSTFSNGAFLPVNEISTIQVISLNTTNINQQAQLAAIRDEITAARYDLDRKRRVIGLLEEKMEVADMDSVAAQDKKLKKTLDSLRKKENELSNAFTESKDSLIQKITEYETALSEMNINDRNQEILAQIHDKYYEDEASSPDKMTAQIKTLIAKQAGAYNQMSMDFDLVEKYFNRLFSMAAKDKPIQSLGFLAPNKSFSIDSEGIFLGAIVDTMSHYGYYSDALTTYRTDNRNGFNEMRYNDMTLQLERFYIKEYITNKRFTELQKFILITCEEIGKLLQNKYSFYSRKLNSVKDKDYITKEDAAAIAGWQEELTSIFNFIQDISSDFTVLTRYLSVDNSSYKDILTNIATYYIQLLNFLKNFDYLEEANATEDFTLPASTNLTNIDLIRYTIERDDKLTNGKQSYPYDIWLRGGLKIDFSAGIFCTGLADNAYSKSQLLRSDGSVATGDTFAVKTQDIGRYNFAFGGMVNIYPRLGASWVTAGLSVGVAYANNQKLQILMGGSIHLGKTERLILHGGAAVGQVKTVDLSAFPYVYDKPNSQYVVRGDMSSFNIPLIDRFMVQGFIGLSYNLSKKNALMAVSGAGVDKYNSVSGTTTK